MSKHYRAILSCSAIVAGLAVVTLFAPSVQAASAKMLKDCRDCPEMVVLPAGQYLAGSSSAETGLEHVEPALAAREQPQIKATIGKSFAIGRYHVTRGQFATFVKETGRTDMGGCAHLVDGPTNSWAAEPGRTWANTGFPQTDEHPAICLNYADANAYAAWLSKKTGQTYRLPTGMEWEYAARGGATTARWWGDQREGACDFASVSDKVRESAHSGGKVNPDTFFQCSDKTLFTAPVGSFKANGFGLYDAMGNVWQWTTDCLTPGLVADPQASTSGDCTSHIDRGGSWTNSPKYVRLASRHSDLNDARNTVLGFRLVREIH